MTHATDPVDDTQHRRNDTPVDSYDPGSSSKNTALREKLLELIAPYTFAEDSLVNQLEALITSLTNEAELRGRMDELEQLITKLNMFEELKEEPSKMLKYPNSVILERRAALLAQHSGDKKHD